MQKGRSGVGKLFLAIIIIAVVVIGIVMYIQDVVKKENIKDLQADLLLVQAKVEVIAGNYNMNKEANPLKGIKLSRLDRRY